MTSTELVLTEQIITTWSSEGRNKLFTLAKTHWKGTHKDRGASSHFRSILYFLCQQTPNGKLKQDEVINFLLALLKQKEMPVDREQFQSCLVDILCVLDAEVACVNRDSKAKKESFYKLVKELVDRKLMSETLLKERFDFDTLEQLGKYTYMQFYSLICTFNSGPTHCVAMAAQKWLQSVRWRLTGNVQTFLGIRVQKRQNSAIFEQIWSNFGL